MTGQKENNESSFRDKLSTVSEKGERVWIYPKKPKGRYYSARGIVSIFLLLLLFTAPLLKIDGQPLFLFNFFERKFIIFGLTFWPQDFHLFVLAMITFVVFIVLFTVVFGRLWCGWACPQTIFMELVFRKIEYWIEGDYKQQKRLDESKWNREKILKKGTKHIIFFAIAALIGHTFMAYMVGIDQTIDIVTQPPSKHLSGFIAVILFSGVFYFIFAKFREQACTIVCPYGRLQGAMLDKNSIVVAYDFIRGEPRGKMKRGEEQKKGDCVDCNLCVHVCPTGIDIRNGTQLECVNCTACIDACDEVMDKINRPKGLIRYDSYNHISNGTKFKLTPRIIAYTLVLIALLGILAFSLTGRSDIETTVLRAKGGLYQKVGENYITNLYNIQIINKTMNSIPVEVKLINPNGKVKLIGKDLIVPERGIEKGSFLLEIHRDSLMSRKTEVELLITSKGKKIEFINTNFLGPFK